jgi:hypothetical protein
MEAFHGFFLERGGDIGFIMASAPRSDKHDGRFGAGAGRI